MPSSCCVTVLPIISWQRFHCLLTAKHKMSFMRWCVRFEQISLNIVSWKGYWNYPQISVGETISLFPWLFIENAETETWWFDTKIPDVKIAQCRWNVSWSFKKTRSLTQPSFNLSKESICFNLHKEKAKNQMSFCFFFTEFYKNHKRCWNAKALLTRRFNFLVPKVFQLFLPNVGALTSKLQLVFIYQV